MSASATFFDRKLCNGMGLCAINDINTVRDDELSTEVLERLLLEMDPQEQAAIDQAVEEMKLGIAKNTGQS